MTREANKQFDGSVEVCNHRSVLHTWALVLGGWTLATSALHLWPFNGSRLWEMLCLSNMGVIAWVIAGGLWLMLTRNKDPLAKHSPDISICAFLLINAGSIAFSPDIFRSVATTGKLALAYVGGYTLFSCALHSRRQLARFYSLGAWTLAATVAYCIGARLMSRGEFGFHGNAHKYGTYVAMLAPLCTVFLMLSSRLTRQIAGAVLCVASMASVGTVGALAALASALVTSAVLVRSYQKRLLLCGTVLCGALLIAALWPTPFLARLRGDASSLEKDGVNLKQRYLEWQAEVNLLQSRTATGTGAGCLNEYRSMFYGRLPKLNTLEPFDYNGWLMIAAETGILGLVSYAWIVVRHGRTLCCLIRRGRKKVDEELTRHAVSASAGLIAGCVVNMFSSVNYNGIVIVFVLILAMARATERVFNETED